MIDARNVISGLKQLNGGILTGFRTHKAEKVAQVKSDTRQLRERIFRLREVQYADAMEAARASLEKLVEAVEEKVSNGVLFSEAALKELNLLLEGFNGYLCNINDYLITGNEVLRQHIREEAAYYTDCARDFATKHEERLIKGVCQPRSSTIFLNMLDGISGMFYNLARIADV